MKKEKKELIKNFKAVIEDLLDNYEQYTAEEQAEVQEIFQRVVKLNTVLDKYDIAKKSYWEDYFNAVGQYFNSIYY